MPTFQSAAVVGLGLMGRGIAQVIAQAGVPVVVLEADQSRLDAGVAAIDAFLVDGQRRGKVSESARKQTLGNITPTTNLSDLSGAEIVVEAIVESREAKQSLLADLQSTVGADTVLATNTSALSVTDLASGLDCAERVAGMHFFNPAPLMPVVEIVSALQTSPEVVQRLVAFTAEIGKTPIEVKDRPGFLVNRLLMPYLNDVIDELDAGLASADDIDTALRLGLGYRMGPLELLDLIGLDTHHHATHSAYDATLDPAYAPPPLLSQMVAAGYYGRKSGRGFRIGIDEAGAK